MASLSLLLILVVCSIQQTFSAQYFKFMDCGTDPNRNILVQEVDASPHPLKLPGTISVHFIAKVVKAVGENAVSMDISINKTVLGRPQKIPCIKDVGTCHYDNVCSLLTDYKSSGCPKEIAGTNLPCFCPFKVGTVSLKPTNFVVEKLNVLFSWLASGTFQVRVQLSDSVTKKEVGCIYAQVQIGEKGFLFG